MYGFFKKILIPTDNSENSADALRLALDLGEKYGASVHVLHVVHTSYLTEAHKHESHRFLNVESPHTYEKDLIEERTKETNDFVRATTGGTSGVTVDVKVREGDPPVEILKAAEEKGVDLIVIGTHGRTGLLHVLMGSVAEKIVRKASCPVLTVKHEGVIYKAA